MSLPLTDFFALLGVNLVCCAVLLRLLSLVNGVRPGPGWWVLGCFVLLCLPAGAAQLPVVAYIRGVSSDFSITLVMLACIGLAQGLFGFVFAEKREYRAIFVAVAGAAVFLYPLALGWGDWDAYRPGWGSAAMWAVLLGVCVLAWVMGLMLLPLLIALALLAWTAGLLESTNLWDYLLDPWLVIVSFFQCASCGIGRLKQRLQRVRSQAAQVLPD